MGFRVKNCTWLPDRVRRQVYESSNRCCTHCGRRVLFGGRNYSPYDPIPSGHIDHIVPRNKGGLNEESNLRVLCFSCNSAKGDKCAAV